MILGKPGISQLQGVGKVPGQCQDLPCCQSLSQFGHCQRFAHSWSTWCCLCTGCCCCPGCAAHRSVRRSCWLCRFFCGAALSQLNTISSPWDVVSVPGASPAVLDTGHPQDTECCWSVVGAMWELLLAGISGCERKGGQGACMGRRRRHGGGWGGASINHKGGSVLFPGRRMQGEAPGLLPRDLCASAGLS